MDFEMTISRSVCGYPKPDGSGLSALLRPEYDKFGMTNFTNMTTVVACWRNSKPIQQWFYDNVLSEDGRSGSLVDVRYIRELRETALKMLETLDGKRFVMEKAEKRCKKGGLYKSMKFNVSRLDEMYGRLNTMFVVPRKFDKVVLKEFPLWHLSRIHPFENNAERVAFVLDLIRTVLMFDRLLAEHDRLVKENVVYYTYSIIIHKKLQNN